MERIRIVLLAVVAAIAYGIAHDQVTARICVEYFTIGHPPLVPTTSPTLRRSSQLRCESGHRPTTCAGRLIMA